LLSDYCFEPDDMIYDCIQLGFWGFWFYFLDMEWCWGWWWRKSFLFFFLLIYLMNVYEDEEDDQENFGIWTNNLIVTL